MYKPARPKVESMGPGREHRRSTAQDVPLVGRPGGQPDEDIREAILDGTFFDVVELYRHILKRKVEKPGRKTEEVKR